MKHVRVQMAQGDILLSPVDALPKGVELKRRDDRIVARGEATGHNHAVTEEAVLFEDNQGRAWIVAEKPALLSHQEHGTLAIDKGVWEVARQVQRDPFTGLVSRVSD